MAYYIKAPAKIAECHDCGEKRMCSVYYTDPEPETGYVDEWVICEECETPKAGEGADRIPRRIW